MSVGCSFFHGGVRESFGVQEECGPPFPCGTRRVQQQDPFFTRVSPLDTTTGPYPSPLNTTGGSRTSFPTTLLRRAVKSMVCVWLFGQPRRSPRLHHDAASGVCLEWRRRLCSTPLKWKAAKHASYRTKSLTNSCIFYPTGIPRSRCVWGPAISKRGLVNQCGVWGGLPLSSSNASAAVKEKGTNYHIFTSRRGAERWRPA